MQYYSNHAMFLLVKSGLYLIHCLFKGMNNTTNTTDSKHDPSITVMWTSWTRQHSYNVRLDSSSSKLLCILLISRSFIKHVGA